jgi:hypothetical protein
MKTAKRNPVNLLALLETETNRANREHAENFTEAHEALAAFLEAAETACERLDEEGRSSKALRAAMARVNGKAEA